MVFVGIDVNQDWLDVHIHPLNASFRLANAAQGWHELADRLADHPHGPVGAEASGGYEKGVLGQLAAAGFVAHCLDAGKVRLLARAGKGTAVPRTSRSHTSPHRRPLRN
jgi:transposase